MGAQALFTQGHRRAAVASLAAALLLGCGTDPAAGPSTTRSTADSGPPPEAPSTSEPSEPRASAATRSPKCQYPQLKANQRIEYPLAQVFWLVTSDLDGRSAAAAQKARVSVERAVDMVREGCGRIPPAMGALREEVHRATAAPLGVLGLRSVEDALARWVGAVGNGAVNHLQGAADGVRACARLNDQVRAGYALWWDYSPEGKRWWVQMQVENETAKGHPLELSGEIWVTGLVDPRPDRYMRRDEKRGGRELGWGGSSADFMSARPFTTTSQRIGLGAIGFVHTRSEGTVYGVRPDVFLRYAGNTCSLPVRRLN